MIECVANPNVERIWQLFDSHKRMRTVIQSVIELGTGTVSVDSVENPSVAVMVYPPIILLAGNAFAEESTAYIRSIPQMTPVVCPTAEWEQAFRNVWGSRVLRQKRTMLNPSKLSPESIRSHLEDLPDGFTLERLNGSSVRSLAPELIMPIKNFYGVERFIEEGVGFGVRHNDSIVSVAHTAFPFVADFEVQVTTLNRPEYRRKGLATAVASALIEYSLTNGLMPQWDAANDASVNLALKLGYCDPDEWFIYFWKQ